MYRLKTFHIHIRGIVQGVGFRPFVYKYALKENLTGWVNNTSDGVHIHINTTKSNANMFLHTILTHLPPLAVVTSSEIQEVSFKKYSDFSIVKSKSNTQPNLILTPDVALCDDCKEELYNTADRRYQYPFITCTNCGPRYSIISELPYDRPNTTMADFIMCKTCQKEYNNPLERRHFSQTNSCSNCKVEMQLFEDGELQENFTDLSYIVSLWEKGKIIAIKGIGGYLLTCDATNPKVIRTLRERKHRPKKPFALMYPDIDMIQKDVFLSTEEQEELTSISAPIVLLKTRPQNHSGIALQDINSSLARIGVMIPYTPLYKLLLGQFNKPIIATSGNITDSTIVFTDQKAIEELSQIADCILLNNREIVIPQDDGVVQFTRKHQQKITLRRSRGKAPTYINTDLKLVDKTIFAAGSMLKSTFGLLNRQNVYISQYLGNTASYEAQVNYEKTYSHLEKIFQIKVEYVIIDKHPDYFATGFGKELAKKYQSELYVLQHHKAHFYSVLGENNLLKSKEPVLGVVWDGTGLGDDGMIWGGEFFKYADTRMERVFHLDEFDFIVADKMVKEPRISALAIGYKVKGIDNFIKDKFTETEYKIYQKLLQNTKLKSTSMGRVFDAVSSILFENDRHTFDAEASMRLEQMAASYYYSHDVSLENSYLFNREIPGNFVWFLIEKIIDNLEQNVDKKRIAAEFHITLVNYIILVANKLKIHNLAFSGGVFQNALLVDMLLDFMGNDFQLYFHKELSPNDEGIPFGQLMYFNNKA